MILTDTGPLVALIDADDDHHAACIKASKSLNTANMVTTWACFTEAMYLLGESGGQKYQARLWAFQERSVLALLDISASELNRMRELMKQYGDLPMDLADASLVAVAESRGLTRIFTTDSDFYVYRLADGSMMEVIR